MINVKTIGLITITVSFLGKFNSGQKTTTAIANIFELVLKSNVS